MTIVRNSMLQKMKSANRIIFQRYASNIVDELWTPTGSPDNGSMIRAIKYDKNICMYYNYNNN